MTTYVVMAPPEFDDLNGDPAQIDRLEFVPDRFSVLAFLFSIIWLLVNRMWLVLLGYLALTLVVELLALAIGGEAMGIAAVLMSFLFGLEAQALRRWSLGRKGWRVLGIAEGAGREETEIRFFHSFAEGTPLAPIYSDRQRPRSAPEPIIPRIGSEQVVGLTLGPETRQ
ncbi:MAG: DUF2628 domain-containing protein [Roseibium sp.]